MKFYGCAQEIYGTVLNSLNALKNPGPVFRKTKNTLLHITKNTYVRPGNSMNTNT